MENTSSANMEDFNATGWKIMPCSSVEYIDDKTHWVLLDESLYKYADIWRALKEL